MKLSHYAIAALAFILFIYVQVAYAIGYVGERGITPVPQGDYPKTFEEYKAFEEAKADIDPCSQNNWGANPTDECEFGTITQQKWDIISICTGSGSKAAYIQQGRRWHKHETWENFLEVKSLFKEMLRKGNMTNREIDVVLAIAEYVFNYPIELTPNDIYLSVYTLCKDDILSQYGQKESRGSDTQF